MQLFYLQFGNVALNPVIKYLVTCYSSIVLDTYTVQFCLYFFKVIIIFLK